VETKRFVGSFVNVILTRQTCGQRSSRAAESKRRALGNYFSERICYVFLISKCRGDSDLDLCTTLALAKRDSEPQRNGKIRGKNVFRRRKNGILLFRCGSPNAIFLVRDIPNPTLKNVFRRRKNGILPFRCGSSLPSNASLQSQSVTGSAEAAEVSRGHTEHPWSMLQAGESLAHLNQNHKQNHVYSRKNGNLAQLRHNWALAQVPQADKNFPPQRKLLHNSVLHCRTTTCNFCDLQVVVLWYNKIWLYHRTCGTTINRNCTTVQGLRLWHGVDVWRGVSTVWL